jgi:hypothetical protein
MMDSKNYQVKTASRRWFPESCDERVHRNAVRVAKKTKKSGGIFWGMRKNCIEINGNISDHWTNWFTDVGPPIQPALYPHGELLITARLENSPHIRRIS